MNRCLGPAVLAAAVPALVGCGGEPPGPQADPGPAGAVAASIATAPADALRRRAAEAVAARRWFAPAGDNAAELLLALRARGRAEPGDAVALTDMQPELVIATEQAIDRSDADEAQRLVELLARIDASAPAIPRLRLAVRTMREAAAAARPVVAGGPGGDAGAPRSRADASDAAPPLAGPPARREAAAPRADAGATVAASPPAPAPATSATVPVAATGGASPATARVEPPPAAEPPARFAPALRLVQDVQPRYPARALGRELEGRVELMFTVRPDGSVADLRIVDAQPAGVFDQAALQAARRWRFAPIPSEATTSRTLRFTPPRG